MNTNPMTVPAGLDSAGEVPPARRDDPAVKAVAQIIHTDACHNSEICTDWICHRNAARRIVESLSPRSMHDRLSDAFAEGVVAGRKQERRVSSIELRDATRQLAITTNELSKVRRQLNDQQKEGAG